MTIVFHVVIFSTALAYLYFLLAVRIGFKRTLSTTDAGAPGYVDEDWPVVSLIIPARDEAASIQTCLDHVLASSYPLHLLEVIVVDDQSTDSTAALARSYTGKFPNMRLVSSTGTSTGKTGALNQGIATSSGSVIMTTDADCRLSAHSIASNVQQYRQGASVVAGSVLYDYGDTAFGAIQALEFLGLVTVGAGTTGLGKPTICNSSNLLYTRTLLQRVAPDGFDESAAADELIIQSLSVADGEYAAFNADPSAYALATPVQDLTAFFRQRLRWASAVGSFKNTGAMVIALALFVFLLVLAVSPIFFLLTPALSVALLIAWTVKIVADLLVLIPSARWYNRTVLLRWLPVAEILHAPYVVFSVVLGMISTVTRSGRGGWK